jgi:broad-specificity NMP kinase
MYISFSGVQGSGKSTLANILYKELRNKYKNEKKIVKFNSITRKLLIDLDINLYELRKNKEGLKVWQYFALKEHFEQLNKLSKKYDIIIMDRCYIDFLVYTEMFIGKDYVEKLDSIFKYDICSYEANSVKFYLEPLNNIDNINDGIRDISCYSNEIELFGLWKDMFSFIITSNNIDERINIVMDYLFDEL